MDSTEYFNEPQPPYCVPCEAGDTSCHRVNDYTLHIPDGGRTYTAHWKRVTGRYLCNCHPSSSGSCQHEKVDIPRFCRGEAQEAATRIFNRMAGRGYLREQLLD